MFKKLPTRSLQDYNAIGIAWSKYFGVITKSRPQISKNGELSYCYLRFNVKILNHLFPIIMTNNISFVLQAGKIVLCLLVLAVFSCALAKVSFYHSQFHWFQCFIVLCGITMHNEGFRSREEMRYWYNPKIFGVRYATTSHTGI